MKKIAVFAGSNSSRSINKELAVYAASLLEDVQLDVFNISEFELPIYGIDLENEFGVPDAAYDFLRRLESSDAIIVSLADHNGSYTAAFKNLLDWTTRANNKLWANKPMLLMATSPGQRGGTAVLDAAKSRFPYLGAQIVATFSLPNFNLNFNNSEIVNADYKEELKEKIEILAEAISEYAI